MRSMQYEVQTYCLVAEEPAPGEATSDGDILTIGSRDKYVFVPSHCNSTAELYLFRYDDGRSTKVDQHEYELRIFALADCGGATDVNLQTGDIILGISSYEIGGENLDCSSGCTPFLYILRPIFKRNSKTIINPTNIRECPDGGGGGIPF